MDSVRYILRKPDYIDGIGYIHPVQIINYDEFMSVSNIICLSYDHFDMDEIGKKFQGIEIKLFDLILLATQEHPLGLYHLTKAISIVLKKEVIFDKALNCFRTDEGEINRDNYDRFRELVMKQNLLFIPKVYKNKRMQEWANKVIEARAKGSSPMTIEDQLSVVSVITGKDYDVLANYSIYQLSMEFKRVLKLEAYRTAIKARLAGDDKNNIEHFAEMIDLFVNPYDDVFKDKSKLNNLNSAIQNG